MFLQVPNSTQEDESTWIFIYRVNGFDSIQVEVNASTMEILSGNAALQQHLEKDFLDGPIDVQSLVNEGILYFVSDKRV